MGSDAATRRYLKDGVNWVVFKNLKAGDLRAKQMNAHARGFEDSLLDGMFLTVRKIAEWSFGPVTEDQMDNLDLNTVNEIMDLGNDDADPKDSTSTSAGVEQTLSSEESHQ